MPTTVLTDTFIAASDTFLSAHTADSGHTWANFGSNTNLRVYASIHELGNTTTGGLCTSSYVPGVADVFVQFDVIVHVVGSSAVMQVGLRAATDLTSYYRLLYTHSTGLLQLQKTGGVTLGSNMTPGWTAGSTHTVRLEASGSTLTVFLDGVQQLQVTDASISAAGVFFINGQTMGAASFCIKNFQAGTMAGGNPPPTYTGTIADISATQGVAITSVNVTSHFADTDALTYSAIGTWPAGITVSSAGTISGTPTAGGTFTALQVRATDTASQTVDSNAFNITVTSGATITTPPLKNNTGTLLASQTGATATISNPTTGVLVVKKTSQTTDASGVMTINDAALASGTSYRVVITLSSGAEGMAVIAAV